MTTIYIHGIVRIETFVAENMLELRIFDDADKEHSINLFGAGDAPPTLNGEIEE